MSTALLPINQTHKLLKVFVICVEVTAAITIARAFWFFSRCLFLSFLECFFCFFLLICTIALALPLKSCLVSYTENVKFALLLKRKEPQLSAYHWNYQLHVASLRYCLRQRLMRVLFWPERPSAACESDSFVTHGRRISKYATYIAL